MLTLWERRALQSGADLIEGNDGWHWIFEGTESVAYKSSPDASRAFLRWKRTGRDELGETSPPIVEQK